MKIKKLVRRYMAGILCAALVMGTGLPQRVFAADEETQEKTVQTENVPESTDIKEETAVTEDTAPAENIAGKNEAEQVTSEETDDMAFAADQTEPVLAAEIPAAESAQETYQHEYTYADSYVEARAVIKTEGILPEDAQLVVKKMDTLEDAQIQTIMNVVDYAEQKGVQIKDTVTYDISFIKDGNEIEPLNGEVEVSITFADAVDYKGDGNYVLLHEKADGSVEDVSGQVVMTDSGSVEQVSFTSSEFSKYTFGKTQSPEPIITSLMEVEKSEANDDNLILNKSASYDSKSDSATISLEAYATGDIQVSKVTKPMDIVLVLDTSGSMGFDANKMLDEDGNLITRIDALKKSVKNFMKVLYEDGNGKEVGHRIYLSTFDTTARLADDGKVIDMAEMSLETIYSKIDTIKDNPSGGTNTNEGLSLANSLLKEFQNMDIEKKRSQMIVLFTDGEPGQMDAFANFGVYPDDIDKSAYNLLYKVGNTAIVEALRIKNQNVPLYTIGVASGANTSFEETNTAFNYPINRFLHAVSSNYPKANAIDKANLGARNAKASYYQTAANVKDLKEAFENIFVSEGQTSVTLDERAILFDTISDTFQIPESTDGIKVYTQTYKGRDKDGNDIWGEKEELKEAVVSIDKKEKSVSVSGFSYKDNYVAYTDEAGQEVIKGKKLVVEITVKTNQDFIGGNDVQTNGDAYIKSGDDKVKDFPKPTVNIPLEFDTTTNDQSIYITNNVDSPDNMFNVTKDGIVFHKGDISYVIDGINNGYVNITYTIKDGNTVIGQYQVNAGEKTGTWVGGAAPNFNNLTADKKYTVSTVVSPSITGEYGDKNSDNQVQVHVFTPSIQVKDSVMFYGEETELNNNIISDKTEWNCSNKDHKAKAPAGDAPELSYTYQKSDKTAIDHPVLGADTDSDTKIKIASVLANGKDIISYTLIKNNSDTHEANAQDHDFTVFVIKGQLNITKQIDAQYTDVTAQNANQTFIFKIDRRDTNGGEIVETFYATIQFDANEADKKITETIAGLKKGYYTVTEETKWASKYSLTKTEDNYNGNAQNIYIGDRDKLGADTQGKTNIYGTAESQKYEAFANAYPATTAFTNTLNKNFKWLSDAAAAVNKFVN